MIRLLKESSRCISNQSRDKKAPEDRPEKNRQEEPNGYLQENITYCYLTYCERAFLA